MGLEYLLDQGGKQTFFLVQKIKYMLSIWDRNHMDLYEEYGKGNMGVKPRNVDDGREPEEGERDADRKGNASIIKEDNTDERTLDSGREKEEAVVINQYGNESMEEVLEDLKSAHTLDSEKGGVDLSSNNKYHRALPDAEPREVEIDPLKYETSVPPRQDQISTNPVRRLISNTNDVSVMREVAASLSSKLPR